MTTFWAGLSSFLIPSENVHKIDVFIISYNQIVLGRTYIYSIRSYDFGLLGRFEVRFWVAKFTKKDIFFCLCTNVQNLSLVFGYVRNSI